MLKNNINLLLKATFRFLFTMDLFSFSPRPDYVVTGPPRAQQPSVSRINIVERGFFGEPIPTTYTSVYNTQPNMYQQTPMYEVQPVIHVQAPTPTFHVQPVFQSQQMLYGQQPMFYTHERRVHVVSSPSPQAIFQHNIAQHQNSRRSSACDCPPGRCYGHGPTVSF